MGCTALRTEQSANELVQCVRPHNSVLGNDPNGMPDHLSNRPPPNEAAGTPVSHLTRYSGSDRLINHFADRPTFTL